MSFTDQKPFVATEKDLAAHWCSGFYCRMCGRKFIVGDVVRWVFTNHLPDAPGNPLVCENCDGPDVIEQFRAMWAEWRQVRKRFAWFLNDK